MTVLQSVLMTVFLAGFFCIGLGSIACFYGSYRVVNFILVEL